MAISTAQAQQRGGPTPAQAMASSLNQATGMLQSQQRISNQEKQRQFDNNMNVFGKLASSHPLGWGGVIDDAGEAWDDLFMDQNPGMTRNQVRTISQGLAQGAVSPQQLVQGAAKDLLLNLQKEGVQPRPSVGREPPPPGAPPGQPVSAPPTPTGPQVEAQLPGQRQQAFEVPGAGPAPLPQPTGTPEQRISDLILRTAVTTQADQFGLTGGTPGVSAESIFSGGVLPQNQAAQALQAKAGGPIQDAVARLSQGVDPRSASIGAGGDEQFKFPADIQAAIQKDPSLLQRAQAQARQALEGGRSTIQGVRQGATPEQRVQQTTQTIEKLNVTLGQGFQTPEQARQVTQLISTPENATDGGNFMSLNSESQGGSAFVLNQQSSGGGFHLGTAAWNVRNELAKTDPAAKNIPLDQITEWIRRANNLDASSISADTENRTFLVPGSLDELNVRITPGAAGGAPASAVGQGGISQTAAGQAVSRNTNVDVDTVSTSRSLDMTSTEALATFPPAAVSSLRSFGMSEDQITGVANEMTRATIDIQRSRQAPDSPSARREATVGHQRWMRNTRGERGRALTEGFQQQWQDDGVFAQIGDFLGGPDVLRTIAMSDQIPNFVALERVKIDREKLALADEQFRIRLGMQQASGNDNNMIARMKLALDMEKFALQKLEAADPYTQQVRDDLKLIQGIEAAFVDRDGKRLEGEQWDTARARAIEDNVQGYGQARQRSNAWIAETFPPDQVKMITEMLTIDDRGWLGRVLNVNQDKVRQVETQTAQAAQGAVPTQQLLLQQQAGLPVGTGMVAPTITLGDVEGSAASTGLGGLNPGAQSFLGTLGTQ